MISVLIPTRSRVAQTLDIIKTTYALADYPDEVEMILRVDDDDEEWMAQLDNAPRYPNLKMMIGPKMNGYGSLDVMSNEMAAVCNGDLIMTLGNDAWFLDKGWDSLYSKWKKDDIAIVQIQINENNGKGTQFPLMTRRTYEILGHYCLHPSIDDYVSWVGVRAGCHYYSDVRVKHDHTDGDYVSIEKELRVSGEYDGSVGIRRSFWTLGVQRMIAHYSNELLRAQGVEGTDEELRDLGDRNLVEFYGWDFFPWSWS